MSLFFLFFTSFFLLSYSSQDYSLINPEDVVKIRRPNFVPETLVLVFEHNNGADAEKAGDVQVQGEEWAPRYYHIVTPLKRGDSVMFRYRLAGYSYGIGQPLDLIWVGYNYAGDNLMKQSSGKDIHGNVGSISVYYNSDDYVTLKFGPIKRYFNAFELHYQGRVGSAKNGLDVDSYIVKATRNDVTF